MSGATRPDYSPIAPATVTEFHSKPATVSSALSKKPNLVAMAALACSAEAVAIAAAYCLSCAVCGRFVTSFQVPPLWFAGLICILMIASVIARGDYGAGILLDRGLRPWSIAAALLQTIGVAFLVASHLFIYKWMLPGWSFSLIEPAGLDLSGFTIWASVFLAVCYLALLGTRMLSRALAVTLLHPRRVVVVGRAESCGVVINSVRQVSRRSVRILGIIDHQDGLPGGDLTTPQSADGLPALGCLDDLHDMIRRECVDAVVIALPWSEADEIRRIVGSVEGTSVDVLLAPNIAKLNLPMTPAANMASVPLLRALYPPLLGWQVLLKRMEDIVIGGMLVLLLTPAMIALAALVKWSSPGPVFFRQTRVGYGGRVFRVFKYRTMYAHMSDAHATVQTRRGDPRVTPFGAWLRRKSLDELPQLLNVLWGDMSLVGPRPHALGTTAGGLPLEQAAPTYLLRQRVRPGLTGWAQINGKRGELRTGQDIIDRIAFDLEYIRNWSLTFDLLIIYRTIICLSNDRNAY